MAPAGGSAERFFSALPRVNPVLLPPTGGGGMHWAVSKVVCIPWRRSPLAGREGPAKFVRAGGNRIAGKLQALQGAARCRIVARTARIGDDDRDDPQIGRMPHGRLDPDLQGDAGDG